MERAETACVTEHGKRGPSTWSDATRWAVASILLAWLLLIVIWLVVTDAPVIARAVFSNSTVCCSAVMLRNRIPGCSK